MVRGLHDMRGQVPGGLVTRWIAHHLERDHGAQPAHVANNAVAPRQASKRARAADIPRPRRVVVPPHDLDRGQRRGAGQRIAAIGSAQSAHRGRVHQIRAPDQRRDRQAGAHGLGQGCRDRPAPRRAGWRTTRRCGKSPIESHRRSARCRADCSIRAATAERPVAPHGNRPLLDGFDDHRRDLPRRDLGLDQATGCSKAARAQASSVRPER